MRKYNAIPCNNPDIDTDRVTLEFKQTYCAPSIQPWPDFLRCSVRVQNCPSIVYIRIDDMIVIYKFTGF